MTTLAEKHCEACRGDVPPMPEAKQKELRRQIPSWEIVGGHHLSRTYRFEDFAQALAFVNAVGAIAEDEGHHPDVFLAWGKVRLEIFTHAIDGLTESDFILAAKCDQVKRPPEPAEG